jgi:hypothetical protein
MQVFIDAQTRTLRHKASVSCLRKKSGQESNWRPHSTHLTAPSRVADNSWRVKGRSGGKTKEGSAKLQENRT